MLEYEYIHLTITSLMTIFFCVIFIAIHSHIWTRQGYEGKNRIFELHEVDKFIAHVMAEASFVALFLLCMLEPLVLKYLHFNFSVETKGMFALTFLGSGAFMAFGSLLKRRLGIDREDGKNN